ncbi:hypothetical protein BH18GEM1_BH18GEM1_18100 [soil metagenome]
MYGGTLNKRHARIVPFIESQGIHSLASSWKPPFREIRGLCLTRQWPHPGGPPLRRVAVFHDSTFGGSAQTMP